MRTTDNWAARHTADQCSRGCNLNPLDPKGRPNKNLVIRKDGGRQCRRCTRRTTRAAMRRLRAERRAELGVETAPRRQCPDCHRCTDSIGRFSGLPWPKGSADPTLCPRCTRNRRKAQKEGSTHD